MTTNSQTQLTDGQKACLRLVDDHHTSKEIARIFGIMYQLQEVTN
jgi:DNA-binding CsgD family transcriptional regulator